MNTQGLTNTRYFTNFFKGATSSNTNSTIPRAGKPPIPKFTKIKTEKPKESTPANRPIRSKRANSNAVNVKSVPLQDSKVTEDMAEAMNEESPSSSENENTTFIKAVEEITPNDESNRRFISKALPNDLLNNLKYCNFSLSISSCFL